MILYSFPEDGVTGWARQSWLAVFAIFSIFAVLSVLAVLTRGTFLK